MADRSPPYAKSESTRSWPVAPIVVGFYAWIAAVVLGATLLDVLLARVVVADGGAIAYPGASEVGDLLLVIVVLEMLAGLAAIAGARRSTVAMGLLVIAVALGIGELLVPPLLSRPIDGLSTALGFAIGPWLRITGATAVSVLAFVALWRVALTAGASSWRR